jgi:hypothetical protein
MNNTINLNRTFRPKVTNYKPDGWGRDTYIRANNGGFKPYIPELIEDKFKYLTKKESNRPSPKLEWPSHRYYSDGSGRDNYITINSGGS